MKAGVSPSLSPERQLREANESEWSLQSDFSIRERRGPWRDALLRRMLAGADVTAGLLVTLSIWLFAEKGAEAALWSLVYLPVWIVMAKIHGLYDRDQRALRHLSVDELPSLVSWAIVGSAGLNYLLGWTPPGHLGIQAFVGVWFLATTSAFFLRILARIFWRRVTPAERTLIIGDGPHADAVRRKLELFPDIHARVVAQREELPLEELRDGPRLLERADRIVLAAGTIDESLIGELVTFCRRARIKLSVVPPGRGMFGTAVKLNHVADLPLVEYNTWDVSRSTLLLKRVLDVIVSSVALAVLSPLFALIALAIKLDSPGNVFFVQWRAGVGGRPFRFYKFRTMCADAEERLPELLSLDELEQPMFKIPQDPRVTRMGRLLRRASLDELPQFLNVLKGEMSLVGPRPEQVELVERYEEEHRFRLAMKPGLTGPMQVYGRGELSFEERLALERDYIENLSLGRDLRILALTVVPLFNGRGAF